MSTRTRARRAGLVLAGIVSGLLLTGLVLWIGLRQARNAAIRTAVRTELGLPDDAFRLERIDAEDALVIALRRVALLDQSGDTVLAAPVVRLTLDPSSLGREGPIVISRAEIPDPFLRLVQTPDGTWNFSQIMAVQADGEDVDLAEEEPGRGVLIRDVRITDGQAVIVTPAEPPAPDAADVPGRVRTASGWIQRRIARDVDALLPAVRVGGEQGWRVEVGTLSAQLENPDVRLTELRGTFAQAGENDVRYAVETLRTPNSILSGEGLLVLGGESPQLEGSLRASPLAFEDLQGLGIEAIPPTGTAEFVLRADSRPGGRTAWQFQNLQVSTLGSEASGELTVLTGGEAPLAFTDTRILLEPLRLSTLERAGLIDSLPLTGEVRGSIASTEGEPGVPPGTLRLDLLANLVPESGSDVPSVVAVEGLVNLGADQGVRLQDVRIQAEPVRLATFAPLLPEQADLLRGTLRGGVTLSGTTSALQVETGDLVYEVGDAPPTRLSGIEAEISLDPALRYDVYARAEPLSLGTLTELFPSLPFRQATLSGPVRVRGSQEGFRFDTDLQGPTGALALGGDVSLGEVTRFDVSGRVDAFRAGAVLASGGRIEGPLTGTFSAAGTTQDFRFDVDLAQEAGAFALGGRVQLPEGGSPVVRVAGDVRDFRVGTLIGRPGLLVSPVSGRLSVDGGDRSPLRFDADLRGEDAVVDLEGFYLPGTVPRYAATGTVTGLSLRGLPGFAAAPATPVNAVLDVEGRGTTPETLQGRFNFTLRGTEGEGREPVQALVVRALADNGVLRVDTLTADLFGVSVRAAGALGLVRPAEAPLRFSVAAPNLARLAAVLPPPGLLEPDLAGSMTAQGFVTGTVRDPLFSATLRGQELRYEEWAARTLSVQATGVGPTEALQGEVTVAAEGAIVPAAGPLESVRVSVNLLPNSARFAAQIRRDAGAAIAIGGVAELPAEGFRVVVMDSLAVQLPESIWRLARPARIAYSSEDGLEVTDLVLREQGRAEGVLEVDGRLPFRGEADMRVRADGISVAQLRRLAPALPEAEGVIALDAVLRGPVAQPELRGALRVDSLEYAGVEMDRISLGIQYANGRLDADASALLAGRQVLSAEAFVPLNLSLAEATPAFELLRQQPMRAQIVADSLPLQIIAAAAPGLADGDGIANADILVEGTPGSPEVSGVMGIAGGAMFVDALGVRLEAVQARLALVDDRIRIDTLTARSEGTMAMSGTIGISDPERPDVYLRAAFQDFHGIDREEIADLEITGAVTLSGRLPDATLSGRVVLNDGTVFIPRFTDVAEIAIVDAEVGELGADTVSAPVAGFAGTPLGALRIQDLQVVIGEGVWAENPDLRVQLASDANGLEVFSPGGVPLPRVFGVVRTIRGTYDLRIEQISREFRVEQGTIEFVGSPELNPGLDITAINEVRAVGANNEVIRIVVRITGTLENPDIVLTSDTRPPLPESELLSYLLFGQPSTQLGGLTQGLPQQLFFQEFIGGQIARSLQGVVEEIGFFDYIRFRAGPTQIGGFSALADPGQAFRGTLGVFGSSTLEAGKQLVENVYLTVELGVQQLLGTSAGAAPRFTFGAAVEWQPTEEWTVRVAREPVRQTLLSRIFRPDIDYQFSFDVRRRWEFGRADDEDVLLDPFGGPNLDEEDPAGPGAPLPTDPIDP